MGKDDDSGADAAQQANLLSQQGIDELRRQFGQTQANVNPFIQAGIGQLGALEQGATVGGFGERLAAIFSGGALDPLIAERTRGAQGQLAAGGLTRSGTALQEISAIPQDIGLAIESLLTGRSQNLAGAGQNAALGLGQLSGQNASNIASIFGQQGQNIIGGAQQDAQSNSGFFGDVLGLAGSVGGALGGDADFISNVGSNFKSLFSSDRDLKENIEPIGKIGPLTLYQWDWIPETKDMIINTFPTMGFVADEVKQHFPEFVKNICGFDAVDYRGVLDQIESELIPEGVA